MQPPQIVDKPLLRQRLARALIRDASRPDAGATFLLDAATDDLIERLGAVERQFETAVAMMGVTGRLAEKLAAGGKTGAAWKGPGRAAQTRRRSHLAASLSGLPVSEWVERRAVRRLLGLDAVPGVAALPGARHAVCP